LLWLLAVRKKKLLLPQHRLLKLLLLHRLLPLLKLLLLHRLLPLLLTPQLLLRPLLLLLIPLLLRLPLLPPLPATPQLLALPLPSNLRLLAKKPTSGRLFYFMR
jgi:hypothetical protein